MDAVSVMQTDERTQAISMLAVYAVEYALIHHRPPVVVPETCAYVKRIKDELSTFAVKQIQWAIDSAGERGELDFEQASEFLSLRDALDE